MKIRFRGPRLGTKLILLGLILLSIPWLGMQSLKAMTKFLFEGQGQAQLLTAQGIATLLHDRPELFNDLPHSLKGYDELPLYPLNNDIQLDANDSDWGGVTRKTQIFAGNGLRFELVLGERNDMLHGLLHVVDYSPVTRHPDYLRLNNCDHVRLYYKDNAGDEQRILLLFEGSGRVTAYHMDENWVYAEQGKPDLKIQGQVKMLADGYRMEFRLPLSLLGPSRQLGIAVADVTNDTERTIDAITGTFPRLEGSAYNLVVLRSPALESILAGLSDTHSRVWILDREKRVRAISGELYTLNPDADNNLPNGGNIPLWSRAWYKTVDWITGRIIDMPEGDVADFDPMLTTTRDDSALLQALQGNPAVLRRRSLDGESRIITAAYPVYADGAVIGAVLMEQSTNHILNIQRQSLERVAGYTLQSLLAVILVLLLFSARLAWRIRRLGRQTSASIDDYGRLHGPNIRNDLKAGDEIGDLARNINRALAKLNQHQRFLANIPRTLRHEINNPLNTISTSLENLAAESGIDGNAQANVYLESARRGLWRIGAMVERLADAASLEDALEAEDLCEFDLAAMLEAYVRNQQKQRPENPLVLTIEQRPLLIKGADFHIEQLLDKLLDNARDFSRPGSAIAINLRVERGFAQLSVSNKGPLLDQEQLPQLFQLMQSRRSAAYKGEAHFGLGLYIARIIAEHHAGRLKGENLPDGSGVWFVFSLPVVAA